MGSLGNASAGQLSSDMVPFFISISRKNDAYRGCDGDVLRAERGTGGSQKTLSPNERNRLRCHYHYWGMPYSVILWMLHVSPLLDNTAGEIISRDPTAGESATLQLV